MEDIKDTDKEKEEVIECIIGMLRLLPLGKLKKLKWTIHYSIFED